MTERNIILERFTKPDAFQKYQDEISFFGAMNAELKLARDKRNRYAQAYRDRHREKHQKSCRDAYHRNAEKYREYARQYRERLASDPVKLAEHNRKLCDRIKRRKASDPNFRLRWQMRGRILMSLKRGVAKSGSTVELVGCTIPELRRHIEKQWADGMSWENYGRGGWHIDHIVPCAAFDMTNPTEQRKCFHYMNLRPMWERDNLSKGSKIKDSKLPKHIMQVELNLI